MSDRSLKVWGESGIFTIKLPEDAKVTFGPWSPPNARMTEGGAMGKGSVFGPERGGTLRIYKGSKTTGDVLAVFAGVQGFRDTSLEYEVEPEREKEPEEAPAVAAINLTWGRMNDEEKADFAAHVAEAMVNRTLDEHEREDDDDDPRSPF